MTCIKSVNFSSQLRKGCFEGEIEAIEVGSSIHTAYDTDRQLSIDSSTIRPDAWLLLRVAAYERPYARSRARLEEFAKDRLLPNPDPVWRLCRPVQAAPDSTKAPDTILIIYGIKLH